MTGVVAANLTELAKTLSPVEGAEGPETEQECLIAGQLQLSTTRRLRGYDRLDCDSISVDGNGLLTIPIGPSGGDIDSQAISKLMLKLLSADVKKLIVHFTDWNGRECDFLSSVIA